MAPLGGSVPTFHTYIHTHTHTYIYTYIFPQKSWQIPIFFKKNIYIYMWFILRKIFLIFFWLYILIYRLKKLYKK